LLFVSAHFFSPWCFVLGQVELTVAHAASLLIFNNVHVLEDAFQEVKHESQTGTEMSLCVELYFACWMGRRSDTCCEQLQRKVGKAFLGGVKDKSPKERMSPQP
jgi:hypothetical protein